MKSDAEKSIAFSIVIPTYNSKEFILRTIQSVFSRPIRTGS